MNIKPQPTSLIERPVVLQLDAPPAGAAPEPAVLATAGLLPVFLDWGGGASPGDEEALARADFILTWRTPVDEAMIRRARRCLVVIHTGPGAGRGVAPVALEAAREEGIYVASIPDYASGSWVEATFALLQRLRDEFSPAPRRPLAGLRLGLVGYGQVGREAARRARAQKMEVWACDPFAPEEPFLTAGVRQADLDSLCGVADILSLHAPLGLATRGLIGAGQLLMMKPGSLLVCTADPELVALDALAEALRRRRPLAAAFDEDLAAVLAPGHPLLGSMRLLHGTRQAGAGEASAAACRRRVADLIVYILRGNRPSHLLIDPPCPRHILLMAGLEYKKKVQGLDL